MSRENVEVMLRAAEAFNRRDGKAFDGLLGADAEITPVRAAVDGTVYRGASAASAYCQAVEESWENLRWEMEDVREADDWVLATGWIRGTSRGSGAAIDARAGWVARFNDGRISSFQTFANREQALEAIGLRE